MGFQVLPADALDLPEMNTLYHDVFEDNDIRIHLWPNAPKEERLGHQLRRYFKMSPLDGSRFVKAVDSESGCVTMRSIRLRHARLGKPGCRDIAF